MIRTKYRILIKIEDVNNKININNLPSNMEIIEKFYSYSGVTRTRIVCYLTEVEYEYQMDHIYDAWCDPNTKITGVWDEEYWTNGNNI